jgi:hypothetical protein
MKTVLQLAAILVAFLLSLAVSFWAGRTVGRREAPAGKPDTVTVERWLPAPIPEPDSTTLRPRVVYLPRAVHDTTFVHDTTAVHDSVLVEVPITEKRYISEDYRATVRGFQPELVDLWIRQKETTIRVPYRKHWSLTAGPQVGYGFTPQGAQPYAGVGVTFGYSF